jgi:hypothetical protein
MEKINIEEEEVPNSILSKKIIYDINQKNKERRMMEISSHMLEDDSLNNLSPNQNEENIFEEIKNQNKNEEHIQFKLRTKTNLNQEIERENQRERKIPIFNRYIEDIEDIEENIAYKRIVKIN